MKGRISVFQSLEPCVSEGTPEATKHALRLAGADVVLGVADGFELVGLDVVIDNVWLVGGARVLGEVEVAELAVVVVVVIALVVDEALTELVVVEEAGWHW